MAVATKMTQALLVRGRKMNGENQRGRIEFLGFVIFKAVVSLQEGDKGGRNRIIDECVCRQERRNIPECYEHTNITGQEQKVLLIV